MHDKLILIGLGANLPGIDGTTPIETLEACLLELELRGVRVMRRSRWYRSAPVPVSDQPWFFNGVAAVDFQDVPSELLRVLQSVETKFGRIRRVRNEARTIDLDILVFGDLVLAGHNQSSGKSELNLPHPELHRRIFVLFPMRDVAPDWRHPVRGQSLDELIAELPANQSIEPVEL